MASDHERTEPLSPYPDTNRDHPLAAALWVRVSLSLRNVEGLLDERDIEVSHEAV